MTFAIAMLCCVDAGGIEAGRKDDATIRKMAMEQDIQLQFSSLGHNLLTGQNDPSGDPLIKRIFSNREVLAWLLVHFIDEYKGCTMQEVMDKYLPQSRLEIGKIPVHPGEAPPESVPTGNVEDKQLAERTAMYDVVLMLPSPNRPGRSIGVVIDIEVQKKGDPGYPIESRMVYYLCRSVSRQRGVTFAGSDYGSISKCYSLWFCPRLAKGEAPSIDRFFLAGERVFGEGGVAADKEDYDLLEGYTVRFNNDPAYPVNDEIRYLQLLLTDIAGPLERLDELHEKYGLSKTREAEDMCNYSEFLKQEAKEDARKEEKLKFLEQLEIDHISDSQIMKYLRIDEEQLKTLREMLREKRAAVMAD